MSVTKECRPKSALRRKAVQLDRQHPQQDLDLTEGEMEQFLEVEQYSSTMTTNRIQSKTEVNQGNRGEASSVNRGTPRLSMSSTSHRQFPVEQALKDIAGITRAQSATYLKDEEDSRYVNQQGVHDLFADILFADTEDCDADNDNTSSDEDAILSSSKSFEEWSEDMELEARINQETEKQNHDLQPKVFKKFLASAKSDGTQDLLTQDNAMMQRLLARTAFDPEEASKLMHQHHVVARTKQFSLGYPELQKATGLRVLKRLTDRQKSVEEAETILVKEIIASYPRKLSTGEESKKKPPARLKPLIPSSP